MLGTLQHSAVAGSQLDITLEYLSLQRNAGEPGIPAERGRLGNYATRATLVTNLHLYHRKNIININASGDTMSESQYFAKSQKW